MQATGKIDPTPLYKPGKYRSRIYDAVWVARKGVKLLAVGYDLVDLKGPAGKPLALWRTILPNGKDLVQLLQAAGLPTDQALNPSALDNKAVGLHLHPDGKVDYIPVTGEVKPRRLAEKQQVPNWVSSIKAA